MNQSLRSLFAAILAVFLPLTSAWAATTIPFTNDYGALDKKQWTIAHGWANGEHQSCEWRKSGIAIKDKRLIMTLSDQSGLKHAYGCGEIQSRTRYGYGYYEVSMRSAAGSGINSNFFTYIGPPHGEPAHDEIDFEFLGKDPRTVQLNYYVNGKGDHEKIIALGFDASEDFHRYAFDWRPDSITWYIDGVQVHQTAPHAEIPSHPSKIFFSVWSGASSVNDWLGPFSYTKPVAAEVEWVKFTPHN
ncbi:MAG: family 16 glycosylhydrolase [Alphaproteobacteria bacterium]|nr:family 16 glycosylhydrolase [Alphaproteobacteria bacterium]